MFYYYLPAAILCIIIFIIILKMKKGKTMWAFLFCSGLLPYIVMVFMTILTLVSGTGLVGDHGGIDSALFTIVVLFRLQWYIYIPATLLLVASSFNLFGKR